MDGATGTAAAIKGYRVAGKTGTGKRIVDGQYVPGDVASFVGMSPAENPRYVVAVFAHTPGGEGGDVAAPAFHQIMQYALRHSRTPPSTGKPPRFVAFR
jgi:cell division protein FtsI (penicillin-binding protein 3)